MIVESVNILLLHSQLIKINIIFNNLSVSSLAARPTHPK